MRIAIAQGTAPGPDALDAAAAEAAGRGARLLLTPELALSGYVLGPQAAASAEPADGPAARRVEETAARHGVAVAYGWPERDGGAVFNTVRLVGPDGTELAVYRKTHLYGDQERAAFTPGAEPIVQADLDGVRIGLLICYDVEFPEPVRAHALAGTDLLAVPTALMRPFEFVPRVLVPARAYENGLHIAYANRCGPEGGYDFAGLSCLAGPDGEVRARAGAGPELLIADVDPERNAAARAVTPYLADRRPDLYRTIARSARP
ncbi:carbon-nitrogen hydrolase family protein [Streptomyces sp. IBSBF 2435]|uniref:carbon-nitrogen hydrolase family protein n=1 Tax=Streptomyces sp. IBSBF 2435 TaxID=2903531 RepID=UPI002FDC2CAB